MPHKQESPGAARPRESFEFDPREEFFPPSLGAEAPIAPPPVAKEEPRRALDWRLAAFPVLLVAGGAIGYFLAREVPAPAPAANPVVAPRDANKNVGTVTPPPAPVPEPP